MNLQSAFGKENGHHILNELANLGVVDRMLGWISRYLSGRSASMPGMKENFLLLDILTWQPVKEGSSVPFCLMY